MSTKYILFEIYFTLVLLMGPPQKALDILKNAFSKLKKSTEKRRKALLNCLAKKEKLSEADETWLDNDGNLVDEERVIEALDAASDFERGVERLSDNGKAALYRLRQAAEDNVSKKRKRMCMPVELGAEKLIQCLLFDRFRHNSKAKTFALSCHSCCQQFSRLGQV